MTQRTTAAWVPQTPEIETAETMLRRILVVATLLVHYDDDAKPSGEVPKSPTIDSEL